MGVVKSQGIKTTLLKYLSIPLGFIASIFIYPYNAQTNDAYGLFNYLLSLSSLLLPLFFLGTSRVGIKYFSSFRKDSNNDRGFLSMLLIMSSATILLGVIVISIFFNDYVNLVSKNKALVKYSVYSICLTILLGFNGLLTQYISNFNKVFVPSIIETVRIRILFPFLVLLVGFGFFDDIEFVWGVLLLSVLSILAILLYLNYLGEFKFYKPDFTFFRRKRKPILLFSLFTALSSTGYLLCTQIDSIMISNLIDTRNNGVYFIGKNISYMISIPLQAIFAISAPIIAKSIYDRNNSDLLKFYRESSNVLLVLSIFLFLLLMVGDDFLLKIINKGEIDYSTLKIIFKLFGVSIIINSMTSINSQIIIYSKYYKFDVVSIFLISGLNIAMNYTFIVVYNMGIQGVALSTVITLAINDILRLIFVYWKFKMHPFTKETYYLIILGVLIYLGVEFVFRSGNSLFYTVLYSIVVTSVYLGFVFIFNLSPQIQTSIISVLKTVKNKLT